jgi:hypothetical protein
MEEILIEKTFQKIGLTINDCMLPQHHLIN